MARNARSMEELIANLDDAQAVLEVLSLADGPVALIYDHDKGWCVTDLVTPLTFVADERGSDYKVSCPADWHRERLTAAVATLGLVHAARREAGISGNQ